jgi:hypothetical protein
MQSVRASIDEIELEKPCRSIYPPRAPWPPRSMQNKCCSLYLNRCGRAETQCIIRRMWVKRGFLFRQRQHEFVLMANTRLARFVFAIVPLDFEKAGNLSRTIPRPASWQPPPLPSQQAHGGIRPASLCGIRGDSVANRRESRPRAWNWYTARG